MNDATNTESLFSSLPASETIVDYLTTKPYMIVL